ncbi:hypothetical protein HNR29_006528 [Rhizobium leguminosarum]|nr:hypothetical protein [Rhizobium leguminosarum]
MSELIKILMKQTPALGVVVSDGNPRADQRVAFVRQNEATEKVSQRATITNPKRQRPSEQSKSTTPAFPDRGRVSSKQHSHEVYPCADNNCPGNDEEDNCNYPNSCCSHCLLHYDWVSRRRNAMQKTRQERVTNTG